MIYHPGHFHGISHEADVQWLVNLPVIKQQFTGDGITTRFRLKFEARKLASYGVGVGLPITTLTAILGADVTRKAVEVMHRDSFERSVDIDDDSHYIIIQPALKDGQQYQVEYHYVNPLP